MKESRYDCAVWWSGSVMRTAPIWIEQNSKLQLVCQGATGLGLLPAGQRSQSTGWATCSQQGTVPQHPDPAKVSRMMIPTGPITFQRASDKRGNRPGIKRVLGFLHSTWKQQQRQKHPLHNRGRVWRPSLRQPSLSGCGWRSQARLARTPENN